MGVPFRGPKDNPPPASGDSSIPKKIVQNRKLCIIRSTDHRTEKLSHSKRKNI